MGELGGNRKLNLMFFDSDAEVSELHRVEVKAGRVGISGSGLTALPTQFGHGD